MIEYKPPFSITNEIVLYVSSISEKIGNITAINNIDSRPHLRKNNRIQSIYSSLKIEANSLSLGEVRDVINGRTVIGTRKEIQEVKNAYDVYEQIDNIDPYDIEQLKFFHGIMTRYLEDESGTFRKGEEGVFDGERCIFMAPPAHLVPELMNQLFSWMNSVKKEIHPLILSSIFHYEFVFIHPFTDGNGRMARLWHTAILSKWNSIFEYIPIENQIEKFQNDYYEAIAKCNAAGDSTVFIEFILSQIDSVLDDFFVQTTEQSANIPNTVKLLLDVMEYDIDYTTKDLMEKLNLKSREGFRRNYLVPAINIGLVKMTIPDKPNSRNQSYIKIY